MAVVKILPVRLSNADCVCSFRSKVWHANPAAHMGQAKGNQMIPMSRCAGYALVLLALLAGGCKRQSAGPSAGGTTNAVPSDQQATAAAAARSPGAPAPMPYTPLPVAAPDNGDVNATLQQLSRELRKYVVTTRSVPKSFEEFVAKSHAQVPPAPEGKKYAIQGHVVVLVKR